MTELKPCPFCGGEAMVVYGARRKSAYGREVTGTCVACRDCTAQMFWTDAMGREFAIEACNRREMEKK